MGDLTVESSGGAMHTEEASVKNGFKDNKKKKRRYRRGKRNHSLTASSSVNEMCMDTDKLYMWALLKKNKILYSEARVLGLGPKFMSIYIAKLAIERRIYYDEVEGLTVEWLDATSTLLLSQSMHKRPNRKSGLGKFKPLKEIAVIVCPIDLNLETSLLSGEGENVESLGYGCTSDVINHEPSVFPLTLRILSTIPVALHGVGGDDGPLDIVARLYISSYFQ